MRLRQKTFVLEVIISRICSASICGIKKSSRVSTSEAAFIRADELHSPKNVFVFFWQEKEINEALYLSL